jgi:cell division cycle 2-like
MTSSTASSLTPLKRSRWEEETSDDTFAQPDVRPKKHETSSKAVKLIASSSDSMEVTSTARPTHSLYVPPRTHHPALAPSRSVYCYERLNQIEEGSYGVVFRARDKQTGDIVALKKLKLEEEKSGFPITALRELNSLMSCRHENVVNIREVVVGDTLTQYVSYTCLCPCSLCMTRTLLRIKSFRRHGLH